MKINFLKETAMLTLKENIGVNSRHYTDPTNAWVFEAYPDGNPFGDFKIEILDLELYTASDNPVDTDFENAKRVYTAMRHLTETQASDERLWSGIAHSQFWEYMIYRHSRNKQSPQSIESRFFFAQSKRRSLFVNTLSRLWWAGRLVYDENREDPFELLSFFKTSFGHKAVPFFMSFTNNPSITRAILRVFKAYEDQGRIMSEPLWVGLTRYVNALGGAFILDCFTEDELVEKIEGRLHTLLSEIASTTRQ